MRRRTRSEKAVPLSPSHSHPSHVFVWLDDWWQDYHPFVHDLMPDGWHHEWNGIAGQGDGTGSPTLRELRQVYDTYKELWTGGSTEVGRF